MTAPIFPTNPANRAPVGMGPFKFVTWEEGPRHHLHAQRVLLDQPRPYLDSVVAGVHSQRAAATERALPRRDRRAAAGRCRRSPDHRASQGQGRLRGAEIKVNAAERLSIDVNITREPLSKPLVRQALLTAIDRERISKDVYQGLAFPAMNAIPEQFTMLTDPSVDYNKQFAYDPIKAGKMLDEAASPQGRQAL